MESTGITALQERRKLNEEIERTYTHTVEMSVLIESFIKFDRGYALLDLYQSLYDEINRLLKLTQHLGALKDSEPEIKKLKDWLKEQTDIEKDNSMIENMKRGLPIQEEYQKLLWDKGVITLPPR